jgi:hypothetical protein
MSKPNQRFNNREEVGQWIDGCIANGMSSQLIYALVQKKTEELLRKREFFLLKRREALVNGKSELATEFHHLLKEAENELLWFNEATGNVHVEPTTVPERILDPEAKEKLLERMSIRMN